MTLSQAQLRVLKQLANGGRIIQRGWTLDMNPCLRLKAVNGEEKRVRWGTVRGLVSRGFVDQDTWKLKRAGRAEI